MTTREFLDAALIDLKRAGSWATRLWIRLLDHASRIAGPVSQSVQGTINQDEAKRVFGKAVVGFVTGEIASVRKLVADPDFANAILGPALVGLVFGVLAYLHHRADGTPAPALVSSPTPTPELPPTEPTP